MREVEKNKKYRPTLPDMLWIVFHVILAAGAMEFALQWIAR